MVKGERGRVPRCVPKETPVPLRLPQTPYPSKNSLQYTPLLEGYDAPYNGYPVAQSNAANKYHHTPPIFAFWLFRHFYGWPRSPSRDLSPPFVPPGHFPPRGDKLAWAPEDRVPLWGKRSDEVGGRGACEGFRKNPGRATFIYKSSPRVQRSLM